MVFAIGAGTIRANPRHNFSKQKYQITTTKSIPINRDNPPVNLPEVGCGYSNGRGGGASAIVVLLGVWITSG